MIRESMRCARGTAPGDSPAPLEGGARAGLRTLALAYALCALPRATAVVALWPEVIPRTSYTYFEGGSLVGTSLGDPYWPPLYALVAELLWRASLGRLEAFFAWHVALHAAIGPLVLATCASLRLPTRAGWLAVVGVALLPYYVSLAARQLDVGIVVALSASVVAAFAAWMRHPSRPGRAALFVAAGFVFFLQRPNGIAMVAALLGVALAVALRGRAGSARRSLARLTGLSAAAFAGLLLAYAAVNAARFGHLTPLPANGGRNLYLGNNPHVAEITGRYDNRELFFEAATAEFGEPPAVEEALREGRGPYAVAAAYREEAWRHVRAHPGQTSANAVRKAWRYWNPRLEDAELRGPLWNLAYTGPYVAYLLLGVAGAALAWRDGRRLAVATLAAASLGYFLPHLAYFGVVRMRMSTEYVLLIFAAYAVARGLGAAGLPRTSRAALEARAPGPERSPP